MRSTWRTLRAGLAILALVATIRVSTAHAQNVGQPLGGYGGSMGVAEMGMNGPAIPYSGKFAGFMPSRMAGSGSLSFQPRGTSTMGANRVPFQLSPMSGGMPAMSGGMGRNQSLGTGPLMPTMSGPRGMGVMPPSFGYPFRQPPSLIAPSSPGMGMSM